MKVALLTTQSRVSPVFETTQTWIAINASLTECNIQETHYFNSQNETEMVDELLKENVEMVICGALPFYIEESLINQGCEVFAFIAGDVNDVVDALNMNILDRPKFKMPGCQKRKRRRNNFCINKKEKYHASNE
ncbi:hypothetical protein ACR30L_13270 [Psychromonas sp. PT13]|uniref:hypothetical protein n=1 Tax=Psychromonas sp. PT13 TaxID=3439547 RepID=UPI003EB8AD2A